MAKKIGRDKFQKLAKYFSKRREIVFVYLFGSYARGDITPLSDIDIAVYLNGRLEKEKRYKIRLNLISEISVLLKRDDLDLVVLNDVDIPLAYEIIYGGKIIYCKDELRRIRFEAKIMGLYFDRKYYYSRHEQLLIDRIAKEGIL